jgi:hypothetical protein
LFTRFPPEDSCDNVRFAESVEAPIRVPAHLSSVRRFIVRRLSQAAWLERSFTVPPGMAITNSQIKPSGAFNEAKLLAVTCLLNQTNSPRCAAIQRRM